LETIEVLRQSLDCESNFHLILANRQVHVASGLVVRRRLQTSLAQALVANAPQQAV
jgi:hypothetical protein